MVYKPLQDKFYEAIFDIVSNQPQTAGIGPELMAALNDKLADKLAANFFSFAIDFQKKQTEHNQSEKHRIEQQQRLKIIEQNRNISKEAFREFVLQNLSDLVQERNPGKAFILDKYCQNAFNLLLGYFHGSGSALNPQKGVCLLGPVGTGKSTLITAFKDNPNSSFRILKAQELVEMYINYPDSFLQRILSEKPIPDQQNQFGDTRYDLLIEEIGREQRNVIAKGDSWKTTSVNVIERILMELYDSPKIRLHMVSNADDDTKLSELYGEAAASRIYDTFNVITLDPKAPNRRFL